MKLTRFLIADNPMVEGAPSAIIHTVSPQAIIEVIEGHIYATSPYRHFQYVNTDGLAELYTLRVHHLFTTEFDGEQHHIITTKLLSKAWHWYMAYMNWEDQQIDTYGD
jgi:hypothetical protein